MTALLLQASAHAIPLADESVQEVVTSPPYWGLRAYAGAHAFAWGGDPEHEHEWVAHRQYKDSPTRTGAEGIGFDDAATTRAQRWTVSAFCFCGAWRGVLGLEPTPELYVEHMVEVFHELWRVLRPDGTVWLNLGDTYASMKGEAGGPGARAAGRNRDHKNPQGRSVGLRPQDVKVPGLKAKDLVGIPWRVALALQADGWWLRADTIWSKPNMMPESATDRPTRSHEYLFLLAKSGAPTFWTHRDGKGARAHPRADYRWTHAETGEETTEAPIEDWQARRIPCPGCGGTGISEAALAPVEEMDGLDWPSALQLAADVFGEQVLAVECERCVGTDDHSVRLYERVNLWRGHDYFYDADAIREPHKPESLKRYKYGLTMTVDPNAIQGSLTERARAGMGSSQRLGDYMNPTGRNARSVWEIATSPYPGAHFATFPERLAEKCVLAGSSRQACAQCGAPWARVVDVTQEDLGSGHTRRQGDAARDPGERDDLPARRTRKHVMTIGWQPTCEHGDGSASCVVLDPFTGTSTTGVVAIRHVRDFVGLDISRLYLLDHSRQRVARVQGALL